MSPGHVHPSRASASALTIVVALLLTGCGTATAPTDTTSAPPATPSATATTTDPDPTSTYRAPWIEEPGPVSITTDGAETIASGLDAPWSVTRLESGAVLVSERDSGAVAEVLPDGSTRQVAAMPGVVHGGEGGLLGIAAIEGDLADGDPWLAVMYTADDGNRIVRLELTDTTPGSVSAGRFTDLLTGIPSASNHNGGRLALGPDGLLYATTGDAGQTDLAQDPNSLAGKILRIELDGSVPADNPFGNEVYSMGHRNPQGLAWDRDGRLWASEFGQDTWDELNLIEPGANYGWPVVEGQGDDPAYRNPVLQWATSEASPSGLTWVGDTLFMASLRGERLWRIDLSGSEAAAEPLLVGEFGRIRDVLPGPEESIWIVTNNTDGRGSPADGDDRIIELPVTRS